MEYVLKHLFLITLLACNALHIRAITNRHAKRYNAPPPPPNDWEQGLREAARQAFLRERLLKPHLSDALAHAPLIGKQSGATPFGDIAILARGKILTTPAGFHFVQDPYRNDCIDCHNHTPCRPNECDRYHDRLDDVMALWTVKRIRHRNGDRAHRYEIEYTIAPIRGNVRKYLTRNGEFDYAAIPGHVFVVKAGSGFDDSDKHFAQQLGFHLPPPPTLNTHNFAPKPGLHHHNNNALPPRFPSKLPNLYLPQVFGTQETTSPIYPSRIPSTRPTQNELDVYKQLLETLAQKTSTTNLVLPTDHRFGPPSQATTPLHHQPTKPTVFTTSTHQTPGYLPTTSTHQTPGYLPTTTSTHQTAGYLPTSTQQHIPETPTSFIPIQPPYTQMMPVTLVPYTTESLPESSTAFKPHTTTTTTLTPHHTQFTTFNVPTSTAHMHITTFAATQPSSTQQFIASQEHAPPQQTTATAEAEDSVPTRQTTVQFTTAPQTTATEYEPTKTTQHVYTVSQTSEPTKTTQHVYTVSQANEPTKTTQHVYTVSQTDEPLPTFYIDPNHPGYPKTTPTTPFTDSYGHGNKEQDSTSYTVQFTGLETTAPQSVSSIPSTRPPYSTTYSDGSTNYLVDEGTGTRLPTGATTVSVETSTAVPQPSRQPSIIFDAVARPPSHSYEDEDFDVFPVDEIARTTTESVPQSTYPPKPTEGFLLRDENYIPKRKDKQQLHKDVDVFDRVTTTEPTTDDGLTVQTVDTHEIDEVFESITPTIPVRDPKEFDSFFGRKYSTTPIPSSKERTTQPIKIIYSDFFDASTVHPTTNKNYESTLTTFEQPKSTLTTFKQRKTTASMAKTQTTHETSEPSTSLSYSTSITFEVNKRNKTHNKCCHHAEVQNNNNYTGFKTEQATIGTATTAAMNTHSNADDKKHVKVLNDFALSLVNNAKSIEYLENTAARSSSKRPKYKRRSFARIRRVQKPSTID